MLCAGWSNGVRWPRRLSAAGGSVTTKGEKMDDLAERIWHEIRAQWPGKAGSYADVHRAIHVFGEGAAEAVADFHVRKARAEGAIR